MSELRFVAFDPVEPPVSEDYDKKWPVFRERDLGVQSTHCLKQLYGPAMRITDPNDAIEYKKRLIAYHIKWSVGVEDEIEGLKLVEENLLWYAEHHPPDTESRVRLLFSIPTDWALRAPPLGYNFEVANVKRNSARRSDSGLADP